jgi:hypothetical protein
MGFGLEYMSLEYIKRQHMLTSKEHIQEQTRITSLNKIALQAGNYLLTQNI